MTRATVQVPAKINLSLGVGAVRADGMHPLATVYQAVDLFDTVSGELRNDGVITISTQLDLCQGNSELSVPDGADNLAVKAAVLLRSTLENPQLGVDLRIEKSIPIAGGMAGGSADAAAALVVCNELWAAGLSRRDLEPLAAELGSDVPFLLHGGIALGTGRGEKISQVLAQGEYHWVFVTSNNGLSTARVYAEFDRLYPDAQPTPQVSDELMAALRKGELVRVGTVLSNDLQEATLQLRPELRAIMEQGLLAGAIGTIVSGSGPTVAFLAGSADHAAELALILGSLSDGGGVLTAQGPVPGARLI